jgi:hypothetical protein
MMDEFTRQDTTMLTRVKVVYVYFDVTYLILEIGEGFVVST